MKKITFIVLLLIILSGCATINTPKGYSLNQKHGNYIRIYDNLGHGHYMCSGCGGLDGEHK